MGPQSMGGVWENLVILAEGGLGIAGGSGSLGLLKVLGNCKGNWGSQGYGESWRGSGWSGGT